MADERDQLAERARAGDAAAFDALIRREKAALYAFIRRYVGDADQAYDILQETFVAAWRALRRYDPSRSFGVWVRRIALNKCRDHGRRSRVRRLAMVAFARDPVRSRNEARPVDDPLDDRLRRLDKAIARLPAFYKAALLLTTAGGLSQEAAASVLGISAKAVEMRLYRARRQLAEILNADPEG